MPLQDSSTMNVTSQLLPSALLLLFIFHPVNSGKWPECRVIWLFKLSCAEPLAALKDQVKAWSIKTCKDSQEECMYELVKDSASFLQIKHTSSSTHSTSELVFEFNPPSAPSFCSVKATSVSKSSNSTSNNYCLLYNLMDASGLTQKPDVREICRDSMCSAKKTATCRHEQMWMR